MDLGTGMGEGERERERLVLVTALSATAWRACMLYLLFCCFVSECTLTSSIYLLSTSSAEDAGMTGHCFLFMGHSIYTEIILCKAKIVVILGVVCAFCVI